MHLRIPPFSSSPIFSLNGAVLFVAIDSVSQIFDFSQLSVIGCNLPRDYPSNKLWKIYPLSAKNCRAAPQ